MSGAIRSVEQLAGKKLSYFHLLAQPLPPAERDLFLSEVAIILNSDPTGSSDTVDRGGETIALARLLVAQYQNLYFGSITVKDIDAYKSFSEPKGSTKLRFETPQFIWEDITAKEVPYEVRKAVTQDIFDGFKNGLALSTAFFPAGIPNPFQDRPSPIVVRNPEVMVLAGNSRSIYGVIQGRFALPAPFAEQGPHDATIYVVRSQTNREEIIKIILVFDIPKLCREPALVFVSALAATVHEVVGHLPQYLAGTEGRGEREAYGKSVAVLERFYQETGSSFEAGLQERLRIVLEREKELLSRAK